MPAYRDGGRWRYRKWMQLGDGRRIRVCGSPAINTKQAAEAAERAHIERALNPALQRKEAPSFSEFVEKRWLPTYPPSAGNRPGTIREKEIYCRVHLVPFFRDTPLDRIKGELVDKFFAGLREKGLKAKSVKNLKYTLRRILQSAVDWGLLGAVPQLPKVKVPEAGFDFYVKEESDQLVAAGRSPEERALLLFPVHTGARAGEQLALEWGDLDWRSKKVVFRRSSTLGVVGPTKNGKERKVPLTATLLKALRAVRHLRGPLVFCNDDGSPLTIDQLHERLWVASRKAGLRRIKWHELRHSFASQLAIAGVPLPQIQEWMGHSSITMTMRYAHLAPGDRAELISALEAPQARQLGQRVGNEDGAEGGTADGPAG